MRHESIVVNILSFAGYRLLYFKCNCALFFLIKNRDFAPCFCCNKTTDCVADISPVDGKGECYPSWRIGQTKQLFDAPNMPVDPVTHKGKQMWCGVDENGKGIWIPEHFIYVSGISKNYCELDFTPCYTGMGKIAGDTFSTAKQESCIFAQFAPDWFKTISINPPIQQSGCQYYKPVPIQQACCRFADWDSVFYYNTNQTKTY